MDKDGDVTTYEYNELNQLIRAGEVEYTWDNAGNLVSQTTTSGVIVATYTYDSYNRMVTASVNTNSGTLEQAYTYDYLGNRTSKTTDGVTTYYVTDLSSGYSQVLKATTGSDVIYYTRGFELISRNEGSTASYYLYDGGMSVRGITDEAGTLTDTYVFDAFGNEVARTGTTDNSYGYRGEEQDETGLYYLRARYMDPSTGTFTTMDTYAGRLSDPMSLHKYMYANSNPVKYIDPSGHFSLIEMDAAMAIDRILDSAMISGFLYCIDANATDPEHKNHNIMGYFLSICIGLVFGIVAIALSATLVGLLILAIMGTIFAGLGVYKGIMDYKHGFKAYGIAEIAFSIIIGIMGWANFANAYDAAYAEYMSDLAGDPYFEGGVNQEMADYSASQYNNRGGKTPAERAAGKGYEGIGTTSNGGPDYSGTDYIYILDNGEEAIVRIQATGSRSADFAAANSQVNLPETPENYTWHHMDDYNAVDNTVTLQLVYRPAHRASTPHSGACAQYTAATGIPYTS